jgi:hypothetical protein
MKPSHMNPTHLRRTGPARLFLVVCALALVLVAAGCGSSSNEGVATLDEAASPTTTSPDTSTTADSSADPQQAALDWAACMRKNGVDVADPQVGSDGRVQIGPGAGGQARNLDSEASQAARRKCGSPIGNGGGPQLSAADREELQASMLEFAACMRKNGVDMPDPQLGSGGGGGFFRAGPGGGGGGVNPSDPDFQTAQKACQSILQGAIPGGGPAGSGGTGETAVAP